MAYLFLASRRVAPTLRTNELTGTAQRALHRQQQRLNAFGRARRDFRTWVRDGATPLQALRVAIATFRAHSFVTTATTR